MIKIIDYGLGNIRAFVNVFERLNIKVETVSRKESLSNASKIILPGVGAFDHAMLSLNQSGLGEILEHKVLVEKIPILGICVGMQMLASSSDEGKLPGLNWIEGKVRLFDSSKVPFITKLPHMGWNTIESNFINPILRGFNDESRFYFLHSYYFDAITEENVISKTEYGVSFASAINKDNIFGVQFHPEKSHQNGVRLLENFAKL